MSRVLWDSIWPSRPQCPPSASSPRAGTEYGQSRIEPRDNLLGHACAFAKLHPQQKSWSLPTQMRTETRSKFEFPIRTRKFLFFAENSLFTPKNSLFHCVGNL